MPHALRCLALLAGLALVSGGSTSYVNPGSCRVFKFDTYHQGCGDFRCRFWPINVWKEGQLQGRRGVCICTSPCATLDLDADGGDLKDSLTLGEETVHRGQGLFLTGPHPTPGASSQPSPFLPPEAPSRRHNLHLGGQGVGPTQLWGTRKQAKKTAKSISIKSGKKMR